MEQLNLPLDTNWELIPFDWSELRLDLLPCSDAEYEAALAVLRALKRARQHAPRLLAVLSTEFQNSVAQVNPEARSIYRPCRCGACIAGIPHRCRSLTKQE